MASSLYAAVLAAIFIIALNYIAIVNNKEDIVASAKWKVLKGDGMNTSTLLNARTVPLATQQSSNNINSIEQNKAVGSIQVTDVPAKLPSANSKYAYVTLLHGIDNSMKYKGFLLNTLIMKRALDSLGSKEDFIALVGYAGDHVQREEFNDDINVLKSFGIKVYELPRLTQEKKVSFAEMALLKITPWSFTQYEKIQFFDGDILPLANLDCYFALKENTFNTGSASPLNSGWYLAIPNQKSFEEMKALAIKRLTSKWNETIGWGTPIPQSQLHFRGSNRPVTAWNFNGASLDQGLLTHYMVLNHGGVTLLDTNTANRYSQSFKSHSIPMKILLSNCESRPPINSFAHFTGRNKPWLHNLKEVTDKNQIRWGQLLDSMQLPINTSNIHNLNFKSPLGYFFPNKRL